MINPDHFNRLPTPSQSNSPSSSRLPQSPSKPLSYTPSSATLSSTQLSSSQAPSSWPLIDHDNNPAPPFYPLSSRHQALHTTYPSRLRLGTSLLAQPIYTNSYILNRLARPHSPLDGSSAPAPAPPSSAYSAAAHKLDLGRRVRRVVNYAENEARAQEHEHEGGPEEEALTRSRPGARKSAVQRLAHAPVAPAGRAGTPTPTPDADQRTREEAELRKRVYADGRAYLGQEPPAKWVRVQRRPTRAPAVMGTLGVDLVERAAGAQAALVPIRVELETDELRIRDVFTWDVHERLITPEMFAVEFCIDIGIAPGTYAGVIAEQIKGQVREHGTVAGMRLVADDEEEEAGEAGEPQPEEPDLRVVVQLDVQIETVHLVDRIEWDLCSPLTPELFAGQYARELCLPRAAQPVVAHAIHEELCRHKRDCIALGLATDVRMRTQAGPAAPRVESDPLLKERFGASRGPKKLEGVWREWIEAAGFGPKLEEVHVEDVEWVEIEKERLMRRSRRETVRTARRR